MKIKKKESVDEAVFREWIIREVMTLKAAYCNRPYEEYVRDHKEALSNFVSPLLK